MKKIFILTGEPSGDKLASKVISQLKNSISDLVFLNFEIILDANLSPDGSPVNINIFFILQI